MFRPKDTWDRVFEIGIIAKGLNGLVELVGGIALLFVSPTRLRSLAGILTQGELSEDPHDLIATHLLHTAGGLTGDAVFFGAAYLLTHGLIKVVLAVAVLRNKLWAYPWMIGALLLFIGYQLYRIALAPTPGLIALTVFDLAIVVLTWREYGRQRTAARSDAEAARPHPAEETEALS